MMLEPNPTLYIKNIDWKVKKGLLRRALYSLFTRHGKVLEVVALRKDGLRGQAFVIFEDVAAATAALQAEQGFHFFGKDLVLEYAREKSSRIARRDGSYLPKSKRRKISKREEEEEDDDDDQAVPPAMEEDNSDSNAAEQQPPHEPEIPSAPPSKYLLAQNLPAQVNSMMLEILFRQYQGFKEVRMPRSGLAFIEFDDEPSATQALKGLNGFKLTATETLKLGYGKE